MQLNQRVPATQEALQDDERSCIVSLNVAEIGSTVELSNTGNTVAKPSVFVTAPSWCLVLEVSPLGVPSKGFSYFFMDKKVKEKMSFALLHQTLKRGLARASLRMKLMPAAHSPCLVRLSASLVAGPKEVWSIKVRSPFGSPFGVKVKRTCSGRNLWLQVVLATEKLAGRSTVDIVSLHDGNRYDCPLPLCCLGLSNGCTVDAIDKKDQEWVIFIKCPDGSVIATPASKEESCIDLHRRVAAMLATRAHKGKVVGDRNAQWINCDGKHSSSRWRLRSTHRQSQAEAKSGKYQSPDSWLGSERIPPGIQKEPTLADDHSPLLLAR